MAWHDIGYAEHCTTYHPMPSVFMGWLNKAEHCLRTADFIMLLSKIMLKLQCSLMCDTHNDSHTPSLPTPWDAYTADIYRQYCFGKISLTVLRFTICCACRIRATALILTCDIACSGCSGALWSLSIACLYRLD